jgi:hypothetical protein
MKTVNVKEIKEQLNNCYDSWDPNWKQNIGNINFIKAFKYHLEREAGISLDFEIEMRGRVAGYKINSVEVVDDEAFMLWMLRWS